MKINFARRVKFKRKVTIGLSVLLALTVTLIVVAARQFTRCAAVADEIAPMKEEHLAERKEDHREQAIDARRAGFAASASVPVPGALHEYEKDKLREGQAKERRDGQITFAAAQGFAIAEPEKPAAIAKFQRHDKDEHKPKAADLPVPAALDVDNRYAVVADVPHVPERRERAEDRAARPLVIQVSGDSPDVQPHRMDGAARDGLKPDRGDYRDQRAAESRNEAALPVPSYPVRVPNYGYGASVPAMPEQRGPAGYPGPAAGYGRDDVRRDEIPHKNGFPRPDETARRDDFSRRDDFQRPAADSPLRSDGLYEVQPNDSFWTISQRVYGAGPIFARWQRPIAARLPGPTACSRAFSSAASLGATAEGLCRLLPASQSPRGDPQPRGRRRHPRLVLRRPRLPRAGRRYALQHRPQRAGQGLPLGGDLPTQPRVAGQGFRLPDARPEAPHAAARRPAFRCMTRRGDDVPTAAKYERLVRRSVYERKAAGD